MSLKPTVQAYFALKSKWANACGLRASTLRGCLVREIKNK